MTITQEAARGLLRACVRMADEMEWCAAIVGDPMYAGVKHDYRAKLRDLVAFSRAAIAKATPRQHPVSMGVEQAEAPRLYGCSICGEAYTEQAQARECCGHAPTGYKDLTPQGGAS